jgi:hypothetical protein
VGDVLAGGQAARVGRVAIDSVVVAVDGVNVERESAPQIRARLAKLRQEGVPTVRVTFRDSLAFNAQLKTGTPLGAGASVATAVAPGGTGQAEQVLGVTVLEAPERCRRTAAVGDLMEIRYAGRLATDGSVLGSNQPGTQAVPLCIQAVAPCTQAPCSTACSWRRATPTTRSSSSSASSLPASSPHRGTSASSACASASGGSSTCHRCERGRGVGLDSDKRWTNGPPALSSWQLTRVGVRGGLSPTPEP